MSRFGFWQNEEPRNNKAPRVPFKHITNHKKLYRVFPVTGVNVSPQYPHYSTHVYVIFSRSEHMPAGKFNATVSFRTMYNDFRGMKSMNISPCSEDADPQFDMNGGDSAGVLEVERRFKIKVGWVARNEDREKVLKQMAEHLPFPIRGGTMDSEEWERMRAKGNNPSGEWVFGAMGVLRRTRRWSRLPKDKFMEQRAKVKKLIGDGGGDNEARRTWKRRADRARRRFEREGGAREYKWEMAQLGPEPKRGGSEKDIDMRGLDRLLKGLEEALYGYDHEYDHGGKRWGRRW